MNLRLSTAPHIRSKDSTQALMLDVVIALTPTALSGVYLFGYQAALVLAISMAAAVLAEFLWQKLARQTVRINDLSALVTGLILGLNLPSTAPWWLAVIGSVFAVIIVKQLFGGLGDNFMNPAMAARAVLLASWPARMTAFVLPTFFTSMDGISSATLLSGEYTATLPQMFFGTIPGTIGEVSKAAILLGLAYLLLRKTISWRIPVIMLAATALFSWLFGSDPVMALLSGGVMFGAVFMATDYTTSPMTAKGQMIYAFGAGLIVAVIRAFGAYPEGVTYAILLMNIATPLIDRSIKIRVYGSVKPEKPAKKEVKADA
ncbi:MAG: RnfABCDGE type electron transport complex subunit D [Eubacteriales bacterium]|nr:RnfABCDGE type electron transport complex subunit D [Eubacteriales bacterium]